MSCLHTRVGRARPYRLHPWREVIVITARCFSVSCLSSGVARVLLLFGCHAAVHDSRLPPLRRAQEPSAKSHVLSITSTRNTSRCSSQRLVLTFSLRDHLPRIIFPSRWESHRSFEIAKRKTRLVPEINRSWKIVTSCP